MIDLVEGASAHTTYSIRWAQIWRTGGTAVFLSVCFELHLGGPARSVSINRRCWTCVTCAGWFAHVMLPWGNCRVQES